MQILQDYGIKKTIMIETALKAELGM